MSGLFILTEINDIDIITLKEVNMIKKTVKKTVVVDPDLDLTEKLMILIVDECFNGARRKMTRARLWKSTKQALDRGYKHHKSSEAKDLWARGGRMGFRSGYFQGFLGGGSHRTPPDKQPIPFCESYIIMYDFGYEMGRTDVADFHFCLLMKINDPLTVALTSVVI